MSESPMDEKTALELYKMFKQHNAVSLNIYHTHIQHYRALIAAVLGASFAAVFAVVNLDSGWLKVVLMFVTAFLPVLNVWLCRLAIRQSYHPYRTFLETISIQTKLEPIIGLVGQRPNPKIEDAEIPFPEDASIVPARWLTPASFPTADDFVQSYVKKGSNKITRQLFWALAAVNSLLFVVIAVRAIILLFEQL